jgi:lipopolysaccharide transport protein LptA
MVNLLRINIKPKTYLCAALLLSLLGDAAALPPAIADKPKLDAASLELDGPNNVLILTEVRITTQSGYSIKAGKARTTDANNFNNSRWDFTDKVEIATPDGSSTADSASVSFVDNQISTLHITGNPATFEQHSADKLVAQGRADKIDYDLAQHTVRLNNHAWVSYGQNECRAVALVYNISLQRVSAPREEQQGERVNCTINPTAASTLPKSAAAP